MQAYYRFLENIFLFLFQLAQEWRVFNHILTLDLLLKIIHTLLHCKKGEIIDKYMYILLHF